jgi:predicted transcriptional regulator
LFIREDPDAYLREIAEKFGTTLQAAFYAYKRLKISLEKRPLTTRREMRQKDKNS